MSTTSFGITFNLSAHFMDPNLPGIVGTEFITKTGLGFLDVAFFVIALSLLLVFLWLIISITRWSIQGSRNIELLSISVGNSPREFSSLEDIPLITYRDAEDALLFDQRDCPICLDDFTSSQRLMVFPSCQHAFHADCATEFLTTWRYACPCCRWHPVRQRHVV